ncbi:MAG: hypothetical protein PHQ61_06855 [Candidatus Omnitrophica bacterium]|nr:hypothetical protein [Candidatus Omnitrophota bacterium]
MNKSMTKEEFWQNFSLGIELDIAGNFIYNGLKAFDEIKDFEAEGAIFDFLYNISCGVERLQKIAIILLEYNDDLEQELFEKGLITHSHLELLQRLEKIKSLKLENIHNAFLQMTTNFYKTIRYDRYCLNKIQNISKEKTALLDFLRKYLNIEEEIRTNDKRYKKFIGKIIGRIVEALYQIIYSESRAKNLYTYEVRYNSKAFKIFMRKEYDFSKEKLLWKELLIYFINNETDKGVIGLIKGIKPLKFDPGMNQEYITAFQNDQIKMEHFDELEACYEDKVDNVKERFTQLDVIGDPYVTFGDEEI